ncbi:MAG: Transposase IS200 like protein [Firmicutes bacterium ADurb.Bin182]|nr:MAG: Transposase IS200 like protein [Firmicutes bacterium ADurb.Bin182]
MSDEKSLSHTKWNCKYHIVFAPKYRRKLFYGEKRRAIGEILRKLCEWKGVTIVEAESCPDHIHIVPGFPAYVLAYHAECSSSYCEISRS